MRFGGAILRNQLTHILLNTLAWTQFFASILVNIKKKKKSANLALPLWSLHPLCEDAIKE